MDYYDTLSTILSYIDSRDLPILSRTSSLWREVCTSMIGMNERSSLLTDVVRIRDVSIVVDREQMTITRIHGDVRTIKRWRYDNISRVYYQSETVTMLRQRYPCYTFDKYNRCTLSFYIRDTMHGLRIEWDNRGTMIQRRMYKEDQPV